MATSKASTQPPGEALSPKHEAFVQAYVSRGMNGTKAYRAVYPSIKSDDVAGAAAARLLGNVRVQARIAEIMRAGAERAEVTVEQVVRELKLIGFSDIRKVVSWRNELVTRTEKGEDGEPVMVMMPRVTIVDADKISDEAAAAVAKVWQTVNGALRVKLHDKHAALVSIGKHLGLRLDPKQFAGHSLRAGFLTSAAPRGASIFKMMDVSRHRSVDTLRGYVRDAELFKDHAGAGLL